MGTYQIPRNYKGESRILYIFTVKSLITTGAGILIGLLFFLLLKALGMKTVGIIIMALFALVGYAVGAIKIPAISGIPVTKKISGEPLGNIILRYIKFKKNRKMYSYTKEEK